MITIYSTPTCAYCHMVKHYLDSKKQTYKELDITQDDSAMQWVLNHVGQAVTPIIDINGTVVVGFDRPSIDHALSL